MVWITFTTLILGLLFLYLEFFLPGGIIGAISALCLLGSLYSLHSLFQSFAWTGAYFILIVALVIGTCIFALNRVRNSKNVYLNDDQKGFLATSYDKTLVGKEGLTLSSLRLSGHIEIDGMEYQAMAQRHFVEKGQPIKVIGGRGGYLLVKETNYE